VAFLDTLVVEPLPPALEAGGFDCGEGELTAYLCDGTAHGDRIANVACTYLVRSNGELVGYFSVLADAIRLESKERPVGVRYSSAPALKLGRMGVAQQHQGKKAGQWILDYVVGMARVMAEQVGVRYVTLDALKRDPLVAWYEKYGFVRNRGQAKAWAKLLGLASKDELEHVSMRFDILLEAQIAMQI